MASRFLVRLGSKNALCLSASRSVATFVISPPKEALVQDLFSSDKNQGTKNRPSYSLKDATKAVSRRLQWATVNIDAPRSYEGVLSEESSQARIVTEATWPYRVVFANKAWEQLCGWTADETVGRHGLGFMQGEQTDPCSVRQINEAVQEGQRVTVQIVNYKKDGTPFLNSLQITPLRSLHGEYSHMLGILRELPLRAHKGSSCA